MHTQTQKHLEQLLRMQLQNLALDHGSLPLTEVLRVVEDLFSQIEAGLAPRFGKETARQLLVEVLQDIQRHHRVPSR